MGTRSAHVASCLLPVARKHLFAAVAPDPLFGSTLFVCLLVCLFVCLLVCLFVCLFATGLCKKHRRWRGLRRTRVVAW
jgi:cytochrome c biogenesis protein ResB